MIQHKLIAGDSSKSGEQENSHVRLIIAAIVTPYTDSIVSTHRLVQIVLVVYITIALGCIRVLYKGFLFQMDI